ncbi:hypothetical protein NQZ68_012493 [Dissostichus eleginoides]|nr:hypothetical protein NQZ68_012493 [Dissostichus eleginoides]
MIGLAALNVLPYQCSRRILEGLKWESRHLLQEVYENDSKLFPEQEKNCTDPDTKGTDVHRANRRMCPSDIRLELTERESCLQRSSTDGKKGQHFLCGAAKDKPGQSVREMLAFR